MELSNTIKWSSSKNGLFAIMEHFHATIHIHMKDEEIVFLTTIMDPEENKLMITFSSLEEAFTFIQSVAGECSSLQEVVDSCKGNYQNKKPKIKKRKVKLNGEQNNGNLE